jgi:hypothetical protein
MINALTADRLRSLLAYEPLTGLFTWRVKKARACVGDAAGYVLANGYRRVQIDGRSYAASHLAVLHVTGKLPAQEVDHRNRVRDDNRWDNLFECPHAVNLQNKGRYRNSTQSVSGVQRRGDRFRVRVWKDGMQHNVGVFDSMEDAVAQRQMAKAAIHHEWQAGAIAQ